MVAEQLNISHISPPSASRNKTTTADRNVYVYIYVHSLIHVKFNDTRFRSNGPIRFPRAARGAERERMAGTVHVEEGSKAYICKVMQLNECE